MALLLPKPGQVIRYAYLWSNEARTGRECGIMHRPCGVLFTRSTESGQTIIYVLPITASPPLKEEDAIEIPLATKRRFDLNAERSPIITKDFNRSTWPGPDIRSIPSGDYVYGYLPEVLMRLMSNHVKTTLP